MFELARISLNISNNQELTDSNSRHLIIIEYFFVFYLKPPCNFYALEFTFFLELNRILSSILPWNAIKAPVFCP